MCALARPCGQGGHEVLLVKRPSTGLLAGGCQSDLIRNAGQGQPRCSSVGMLSFWPAVRCSGPGLAECAQVWNTTPSIMLPCLPPRSG